MHSKFKYFAKKRCTNVLCVQKAVDFLLRICYNYYSTTRTRRNKMTSKERRERGMLFFADEADWKEMKHARRLLQELNTIDRTDFAGIRSIVNTLFGRSDESTFLNPPFYCD